MGRIDQAENSHIESLPAPDDPGSLGHLCQDRRMPCRQSSRSGREMTQALMPPIPMDSLPAIPSGSGQDVS